MTNSFRKHYNLIMWVIIVGTIVSFVAYLSPGSRLGMGMGGGGPATAGTVDGEPVSQADFESAVREGRVAIWARNGHWPAGDADPQLEQLAFEQLLLRAKLKELGLKIPTSAVADYIRTDVFRLKPGEALPKARWDDIVANEFERNGHVSLQDFENWARDSIGERLLAELYGVNGSTITSQDAEFIFRRLHEAMTVELARFPLTNYTAGINPTPPEIGEYYTNHQAAYRLDDRIVIGYIHFDPTNYNYASDAYLAAHTNFADDVDRLYLQHEAGFYKDPAGNQLTADAAKKLIHDGTLLHERLQAAATNANAMYTTLMAGHTSTNQPISQADYEKFAATNKLNLVITPPFDEQDFPKDLALEPNYRDLIFQLEMGDPTDQYKAFQAPGTNGFYIVGLLQKIPSENQPLAVVRTRVIEDYRNEKAGALSDADGSKFETAAKAGLEKGETFDAICAAQKVKPENLTPFEVDTTSIPDISDQTTFEALANLCYKTPTGQCTQFIPHQYLTNGGFVAYVKKRTPVDESVVQRDLPAYLREQRMLREQAAFNLWFGHQYPLDVKPAPKPGASQS